MGCQANECEINHMEMIETEIERAWRVIYGTWLSLTLEMGFRRRFKVKSGVTMLTITLDTLDCPNTHIQYTLT